jgi:uncharacterized membrane protein
MRAALLSLALLLLPLVSHAQARSYHYASIESAYDVRQDSTVAVQETQTYDFVGAYHVGWRSIPHDKITAITDVSVSDGGKELAYSSSRLDKDDPSSWGKYTVFDDNGATNIEWYYNLANTKHTFMLSYVVHGALAFYKDYDELYWNIFTDYDVPVDSVVATVHVPGSITTPQSTLYTTGTHDYESHMQDNSTFFFSAKDIAPQESVTFAAGWQKGLVDKSAYWLDLLRLYWETAAAFLLLVAALIFSIGYRIHLARTYRGRGTIVPQYEPPQHLPPAMAEVIAKSHITDKAWPATIIDLAVRGYLTIEEREEKKLFFFKSKNYVLTKADEPDGELEEYERNYMNAVFADDTTFSTADIKKSPSRQQALATKIYKITRDLYRETETDTHAFAIAPGQGPVQSSRLASFGVYGLGLAVVAGFLITLQVVAAIMSAAALGIVWYATRVMPALNTQGRILKEEWLGFKMFLEVTGKDRMQDLTPATFERYLPYAMIFGVEKQWAKKFEAMHLPPPQWYHGAYVSSPGVGGGSFSPASFASGFSASFSSSFASSGGGGASGGGGSAGGGGGGGGGGAA